MLALFLSFGFPEIFFSFFLFYAFTQWVFTKHHFVDGNVGAKLMHGCWGEMVEQLGLSHSSLQGSLGSWETVTRRWLFELVEAAKEEGRAALEEKSEANEKVGAGLAWEGRKPWEMSTLTRPSPMAWHWVRGPWPQPLLIIGILLVVFVAPCTSASEPLVSWKSHQGPDAWCLFPQHPAWYSMYHTSWTDCCWVNRTGGERKWLKKRWSRGMLKTQVFWKILKSQGRPRIAPSTADWQRGGPRRPNHRGVGGRVPGLLYLPPEGHWAQEERQKWSWNGVHILEKSFLESALKKFYKTSSHMIKSAFDCTRLFGLKLSSNFPLAFSSY